MAEYRPTINRERAMRRPRVAEELEKVGDCKPAHRHGPTSGHDFISVIEAARRRDAAPKPRLPRTRQETTE